MKILIASDAYKPMINGVVTSLVTLENELVKRGHEVRILTLSQNHRCIKDNNVYYIGSANLERIYPNARYALKPNKALVKELIEWCPDIIHTQSEFSSFHIAKNISEHTGAPIVHTYHTVYEDYTHYFSPSKRLGKKAVVLFTRRVLKHVNGVIVPTEKVHKMLETYGVKTDIYTVPTGIDLEKFENRLSEEQRIQLKKELGIPENNTVLLFLGRLGKEKNIEELINYAYRLKNANLTLLIVGGGPDFHELQAITKHKGIESSVIFTGMVAPEKTALYYQLGDVFVSASQSETQGLTYIEALANGLPAICRSDACLDGVVLNGVNGYQYNDYDAFKNGLDTILQNSTTHENFSQKAMELAFEEYSSETFAKRAEDVYEKALESRTF